MWWPFNVFGCLGPLPLPDNNLVSHRGLLPPEWIVSVEVQIQIKTFHYEEHELGLPCPAPVQKRTVNQGLPPRTLNLTGS